MAVGDRARPSCRRSWSDLVGRMVLLASLFAAASLHAANYVYDANGRLRAVTTSSGQTSEYVYDALGNLLSINAIAPGAVSIYSVTPSQGPAGAIVTVSGLGFSTTPGSNIVKFNGTSAVVTSAAANQIVTSVPFVATTGSISVTVGSNMGTSSSPFTVTTALTPNVTTGVNLVQSGQTEQFTFSGNAGQYFGLSFGQVVVAPLGSNITLTVLNPDGSQLQSSSVSGNTFLNLASLTQTGTHRVQLTASPATRAVAQLTLVPSPGALVIDGPSLSTGTTIAGQISYLTFSGTAGQNLSLGLSSISTNPPGGSINYSIAPPGGGSPLASGNCSALGCHQALTNLPLTGVYTIALSPAGGANTINFTATLSTDVSAALTAGTPYTANMARPGQMARLTINGTSGQYIGLTLQSLTTSPANGTVYLTAFGPDGVVISNGNFVFTQTGTFYLPVLTQTGTYVLQLETQNAYTANLTLLANVPLSSGNSAIFNFVANHQYTVPFSASAGDYLSLAFSNLVFNGVANTLYYSVYQPNGTLLASGSCVAGFHQALNNLPVSGVYTVVFNTPVDPNFGGGVSFTAILSTDLTGNATVNVPYTLNTSVPGQITRLTFSGNSGQLLNAYFSNINTTCTANTFCDEHLQAVYNPDGTGLVTNGYRNTGYLSLLGAQDSLTSLPSLPVTGNYVVQIEPEYDSHGTGQFTLVPDATGSISIDGPSANWSVTPGQTLYLVFSGTVGQNISLGVSAQSVFLNLNLINPDGSIQSLSSGGSAFHSVLNTLPATGTYTIRITSEQEATTSFTTTLSSVLTGTLSMNTAYPISLPRPGQIARLTFAGTAGQSNLGLYLANVATTPSGGNVNLKIFNPDGSALAGGTLATKSSQALNLPVLPSSGTYTVQVEADSADTATAQLTPFTPPTAQIVVDGPSLNESATFRGEKVLLTFSGTAGQSLSLVLTNIVNPIDPNCVGSSSLSGTVRAPDGSNFLPYGGNLGFNPPADHQQINNLPLTGTYTITITPDSCSGPMSFTAALMTDLTGTLVINKAYSVNLAKPGQVAQLKFSGTQGSTNSKLVLTNVATNPSGGNVGLYVLDPSGKPFQGWGTTSGGTFTLPTLPVTGTYSVMVDADRTDTATAKLTYK